MLEEVPSRRNHRRVVRFANAPDSKAFLGELQLDTRGRDELRAVLSESGHGVHIDELLNAPFRPKPRLRNRTRFSDGSFPVFYTSLDSATAEAEVRYWLPIFIGTPRKPRPVYYQRFCCEFQGIEKDIRPKLEEWPDLIHGSDYSFCNRLGAEARSLHIDGLVTWSARHEGANLPVFRRQAVSNPELQGIVAMTYHPDTGEVSTAGRSETRSSRPGSDIG